MKLKLYNEYNSNSELNEKSELRQKFENYFYSLLDEYETDSQAKLSIDKKKEFFNALRMGWKHIKSEYHTDK